MTSVYCFSGSGHSSAVADFFSEKLNCETRLISKALTDQALRSETAVVVFPVYCQNIPQSVKKFLKKLDAEYIVFIATYGKVSYGNVLYEAKKRVRGKVIAGAYVPMGHTFLNGDFNFDREALLPILERIRHPEVAKMPKSPKNIFADFCPAWRSRAGVKIIRTSACVSCNICGQNCPTGAIHRGNIHAKCIRCFRCVSHCPQGALVFKNSRILKKYLASHHREEMKVYL